MGFVSAIPDLLKVYAMCARCSDAKCASYCAERPGSRAITQVQKEIEEAV
jgi:hypothetical protein